MSKFRKFAGLDLNPEKSACFYDTIYIYIYSYMNIFLYFILDPLGPWARARAHGPWARAQGRRGPGAQRNRFFAACAGWGGVY